MENGLGDERMVLDTIKGPEDVKRLSEEERKELAAEIREFLIETTSRTSSVRRSVSFCCGISPAQAVIWRPI